MVTGKGRVRLLGEPVHRLRHAVQEKRLGLLLAAVAIGRGDQFLGLGYGERGEEVGEDRLQRAAQPDVEEVRQVGVADIVVVGWVGGDDTVRGEAFALPRRLVAKRPEQLRREDNKALYTPRFITVSKIAR